MRPLSPTYLQALGNIAQNHLPVRIDAARIGTRGDPLKSSNRRPRNQRIAMNTDETISEFGLDRGKRVLDQVLTLPRPNRNVFQFGLQVNHLLKRNEQDSTPLMHAKLLAGLSLRRRFRATPLRRRLAGAQCRIHGLRMALAGWNTKQGRRTWQGGHLGGWARLRGCAR